MGLVAVEEISFGSTGSEWTGMDAMGERSLMQGHFSSKNSAIIISNFWHVSGSFSTFVLVVFMAFSNIYATRKFH